MKKLLIASLFAVTLAALLSFTLLHPKRQEQTTLTMTPVIHHSQKTRPSMEQQKKTAKSKLVLITRAVALSHKQHQTESKDLPRIKKDVKDQLLDSPCSINTPWKKIQPRGEENMILAGGETRQIQQKTLTYLVNFDRNKKIACLHPPKDADHYRVTLAMSLQSGSSGIQIANVDVIKANYSDSDTESCLEELFTGNFIPVNGLNESRYVANFEMVWNYTRSQ